MKTVNLVHLYPKEMNIYGDNGNLLVLKKRLEWRGIEVKVTNVGVGDSLPKDTSLIIGGGGQDSGQSNIANDLNTSREVISRLLKKMENNGWISLSRNAFDWIKK